MTPVELMVAFDKSIPTPKISKIFTLEMWRVSILLEIIPELFSKYIPEAKVLFILQVNTGFSHLQLSVLDLRAEPKANQ